MDRSKVNELIGRAQRDVDEGALPRFQLALARNGEIEVFEAGGAATTASRFVLFSLTKAVTAGAIWALLGDGRLKPSTRVVDLIPAFGANGKDAVTVEHLLTHTAGVARAPIHPLEGATREGREQRYQQWRLDHEPGTKTEYHTVSAHWVLADLIERITGEDYRTFVHAHLAELGVEGLRLGVPARQQADVAEILMSGEVHPGELADRYGVEALDEGLTQVTNEKLLLLNEPVVRAVGVPGAGAIGRADQIALLFQRMLHNTDERWDPDVLRAGTAEIRNAFVDPYTNVPANRTLGLVVAGDDGHAALRGFADNVSARAFGATGVGGQIAWADPETGLSFCYVTNGLDADLVRAFRRSVSLSKRAAACA